MTRHTRNRQMVEVNRLNPRKKLMVRMEMSSINVSMKSVYAEPKVWDLDPNFRAERLNTMKPTYRTPSWFYFKTNKRLIDKHRKYGKVGTEIYEQLQNNEPYPVQVLFHPDGTPYEHSLSYKKLLTTAYFFTKKQPHISGNGNYFYRIAGVTKYGAPYYSSHIELPDNMKGIFDSEGYRLVRDHGDGTYSTTY